MNEATRQEATILLVDDEPKNIQLLGNLLQQQGYAVEFATSGAEAIQWVNTRTFDLILLDVMMPEIDGYEVCKRLKSHPATSEIPVIFLTAKTDTESVVRGFNLGAVDYVTKPFQQQELLARVRTHVALVNHRRLLEKYTALLEEKNLALQQQTVQLEDLNASKDKFFSIIAHDLKSPLSSFLGFADILEILPTKTQDQVEEIVGQFRTSAKNLFALLENLLTWSRLQRGMVEYLPQALNIKDFVARNVNLLSPNAAQKQITLHNRVLQGIVVSADLYMLDAVIRNLLSNAIKFTGAGGAVEISATVAEAMVTVAVADTGMGIPEEKLGKLFRIDAKFKHRGTAGEAGTGLGLILCKEFVEKNGGSIRVESQLGKGATFFFTLPGRPNEISSS
jgi:two-component system sensor histidine kinase/response regulator